MNSLSQNHPPKAEIHCHGIYPQYSCLLYTSRRKYQLLKLRPDLKVVGIRGNIDTRLRKLYDGEIIYEEVADNTAVSYTHLDVYKRQIEASSRDCMWREMSVPRHCVRW